MYPHELPWQTDVSNGCCINPARTRIPFGHKLDGGPRTRAVWKPPHQIMYRRTEERVKPNTHQAAGQIQLGCKDNWNQARPAHCAAAGSGKVQGSVKPGSAPHEADGSVPLFQVSGRLSLPSSSGSAFAPAGVAAPKMEGAPPPKSSRVDLAARLLVRFARNACLCSRHVRCESERLSMRCIRSAIDQIQISDS